jgi:multicomponent Na+:H+ antiporter subunit D
MLGPTGDEGARFEVGWFAAALHLLASATAIAALAFAIGAVDLASGGAAESEIDGLGRKMPWTFGALALGGLGLSGAPPLAGAWAKLWLVVAVAEKGYEWAGLAIAAGALVALIAFAAPAVRALFAPSHPAPFLRPDSAPLTVVLPTAAAGFVTLALALWMDPIALYLGALRGGQ